MWRWELQVEPFSYTSPLESFLSTWTLWRTWTCEVWLKCLLKSSSSQGTTSSFFKWEPDPWIFTMDSWHLVNSLETCCQVSEQKGSSCGRYLKPNSWRVSIALRFLSPKRIKRNQRQGTWMLFSEMPVKQTPSQRFYWTREKVPFFFFIMYCAIWLPCPQKPRSGLLGSIHLTLMRIII